MEKASSHPDNQLTQLQKKGSAAKDAASLCLCPLLLPTCLSPPWSLPSPASPGILPDSFSLLPYLCTQLMASR